MSDDHPRDRWGAGYIGSHAVLEVLQAGHRVVVLDNLCNGSLLALHRVEALTGQAVTFVQGDVRDRALLDALFAKHAISSVVHFAGLKAVGESIDKPLAYYESNVYGTLVLCQAMAAAGVYRLVFSSSATVYGVEAPVPYVETLPRGTTSNPYVSSKAMVETMLEDLQAADPRWSMVLLRYFNPIGAHPSGVIGEDPQGIPNNLMPYISQVAVGRQAELEAVAGGGKRHSPVKTCQSRGHSRHPHSRRERAGGHENRQPGASRRHHDLSLRHAD
ncbi:NAD-dependent epimerase/dehydratase family protein [Halomonas kalidii]|uniref:NAD-dependent epimerase/dehydratase family protein n=1 Tax=Halomonas kalidii TaxID=3043293 RepID=UPI003898F698